MSHLPAHFAGIILSFAPLFVHRSWRHAQALLIGAILCPGRRTVAGVLRITGRARNRHFVNTHRVLSRAEWSPRSAARILLRLLVEVFVPVGPVVLVLDNTIERRWGRRIQARGIYRDPMRSSGAHFVKTSGLRWMSIMLLTLIPWAGRVWALPFLTALVPAERACLERGHQHKTLLDIKRQMALQVHRWLPGRDLVLVGDSAFSALLFLDALRRSGVTAITHLRLDAALYDPASPRPPSTIGRPRKKGTRRPTLSKILIDPGTLWQQVSVPGWYGMGERKIEIASATAVWHHSRLPAVPIRLVLIRDPENRFEPQGLLCTDPARDPIQIVTCLILSLSKDRPKLAGRNHLPGSACPSRRRDPTAMVRQGYRSYDPVPARPVLYRHSARHAALRT